MMPKFIQTYRIHTITLYKWEKLRDYDLCEFILTCIMIIALMIRSCFKIVDQAQDQGGTNCSPAGIYVIFRGLNNLSQHRDWALDAILKQLQKFSRT